MADSTREAALVALFTTLQGLSGPDVERNQPIPQRIEADGLVVLRDGDPGEPEMAFSPQSFHYQHEAEVEVFFKAPNPVTRATGLDGIMQDIATLVLADRTLGGAVEYTHVRAPGVIDEQPVEGAEDISSAVVNVVLIYTTNEPLH